MRRFKLRLLGGTNGGMRRQSENLSNTNGENLTNTNATLGTIGIAAGLVTALVFLIFTAAGGAASFMGAKTAPTEWTYTLTYDPLDNYAVCPSPGNIATITLTGMAGVVDATAPTSTDFDASGNAVNLLWTSQVSGGGSVVTWTHSGPGTGNFDIQKHVYGFKVFTATPAPSGTVNVVSSGFSIDVSVTGPCPVQPADDRDFTATTQGPVAFQRLCLVPDVKGKKLRAAKRAIKRAQCSQGKVRKAFSNKVQRGRVISQEPKPGVRRPEGFKVKLKISEGKKDVR
jgi:PASTA domain